MIMILLNSSAPTVLIGDDLPELGTDLVTALAALDVNEFAHCERFGVFPLKYYGKRVCAFLLNPKCVQ